MGRALLTFCAAVLFAACGAGHGDDAPVALADTGIADTGIAAPDAHASLPCAACHQGDLVEGRPATVPRASCAAGGCHQEGGPAEVSTRTARFRHRDHARDGEVALSCAGCHTHTGGGERLVVAVDACALCHLNDVRSGTSGECRTCHQQPRHVALTGQALPVPHSALPWVETGCVRCHYDVADAPVRVRLDRCTSCHAGDMARIGRGVGTDLHPSHASIACISCHEGDTHRVRAMSSAVRLVCADCHDAAHAVLLDAAPATSITCTGCHETVHQPQQRLLLGLMPGETAAPSSKFVAGITCRSCHIRTGTDSGAGGAIRGQAESCEGCHRSEYRQVLRWWLDGSRERTAAATRYVAQAERDLSAVESDSAVALLRGAAALVRLVGDAGGQHNLELSDRILRESIDRAAAAYRRAGRVPPPAPALGAAAHEGMCSYCHYAPEEPWDFRRMSGPFHRSVLGLDR